MEASVLGGLIAALGSIAKTLGLNDLEQRRLLNDGAFRGAALVAFEAHDQFEGLREPTLARTHRSEGRKNQIEALRSIDLLSDGQVRELERVLTQEIAATNPPIAPSRTHVV